MFEKQYEFLKRNFERGSLAHAFLFSGQDAESIKDFTKQFIKEIHSDIPRAKEMIDANGFADLFIIRSEDSKSSRDNERDMLEIEIAQVRQAQNFLSYTSYYGGLKMVLVEHADRMTTQAQNSFLKSLEDPKGKTVIFLVTSKPDVLLPTISSRCQQIKFFCQSAYDILPNEASILQGLKKTIGADLAEKFHYAKSTHLEGGYFQKILNVLQKYVRQEFLRSIENGGEDKKVNELSRKLKLMNALQHQSSVYQINERLALETLLLEI